MLVQQALYDLAFVETTLGNHQLNRNSTLIGELRGQFHSLGHSTCSHGCGFTLQREIGINSHSCSPQPYTMARIRALRRGNVIRHSNDTPLRTTHEKQLQPIFLGFYKQNHRIPKKKVYSNPFSWASMSKREIEFLRSCSKSRFHPRHTSSGILGALP